MLSASPRSARASLARPARVAALSLSLGVLALGSLGCAATSPYMATAPHNGVQAVEDAATVVFLRPSYYASSIKVTVIDGKGRFLGESTPESYFAVKMPAGEHTFISYVDTTAVVKANVQAGHVYFVEIAAKEGPFSPRMQLLAVTPRTAAWGQLDAWMAASASYAPDEALGQQGLSVRGNAVASQLHKAEVLLAEYTPAELAARTIGPEDGK